MDHDEQTIAADAADYTALTAEVVSAYVANNNVPPTDLPTLIATTYAALTGLTQAAAAELTTAKATPAQIRKSITHEALISFEDGKPYKTLKRHLGLRGLTTEAYKAKWGLPRDYPVTAASYSEARSALAKGLGLGQIRRKAVAQSAPEPAAAPKRAGRPKKVKETA